MDPFVHVILQHFCTSFPHGMLDTGPFTLFTIIWFNLHTENKTITFARKMNVTDWSSSCTKCGIYIHSHYIY